ncbi:MAG: HDOD domain-containing protein [Pseudomonadota bacterium]
MSVCDALPLAAGRGEDIARLHALTSPHGVALEMMRLSLQDDVSIARFARLAQADPALTSRLIKAANALALGARRPTASLQGAMLRLGVPTVRQLAAAFSLIERYAHGPCEAFDYTRFWTESLLRGLAGRCSRRACGWRRPRRRSPAGCSRTSAASGARSSWSSCPTADRARRACSPSGCARPWQVLNIAPATALHRP